MAIAKKPLWARVLEVVGEIPFTVLTIVACAILFRFRPRKKFLLNLSGHSMNSAGVILLTLLPPMIPALAGREKLLHAIVFIWCAVVGISRVFMGAHFASDVTVGILLSLAIFEVLRAILYRRDREKPAVPQ